MYKIKRTSLQIGTYPNVSEIVFGVNDIIIKIQDNSFKVGSKNNIIIENIVELIKKHFNFKSL
jgi:hypothetical protein